MPLQIDPIKVIEKKDEISAYYNYRLNDDYPHTKVQLFYSLGGINYFSGQVNDRGIYLLVKPVALVNQNGFQTESSTLFVGSKILIKKLNKFSRKELENLKGLVDFGHPSVQLLVEKVRSTSNKLN